MATGIVSQQDGEGDADPAVIRVMIGEREVCLGEALTIVDETLRGGRHILSPDLRGLCVLWNESDVLKKRLVEASEHWPKWTETPQSQAKWLAAARKHGQEDTYLSLYLNEHQKPPLDAALVTLEAWTVLYNWTRESGPELGVKLPVWVIEYLGATADAVQRLRSQMERPAAERLKDIPGALGFSSGRRNVFTADYRNLIDGAAYLVYDAAGKKGLTGERRIEDVKEFLKIDDTRTARRYVKKGKSTMRFLPARLK